MTGYASDTRRWMSAHAHRKGHQRVKLTAAMMGVTARSVQRWRAEDYAKGSPMYRALEAVRCSDDPWALVSSMMAEAIRKGFEGVPTSELVAEYRRLLAEDAIAEGADNALKVCTRTTWKDRADVSHTDASLDLHLYALECEFDERRVPVSAVMS